MNQTTTTPETSQLKIVGVLAYWIDTSINIDVDCILKADILKGNSEYEKRLTQVIETGEFNLKIFGDVSCVYYLPVVTYE